MLQKILFSLFYCFLLNQTLYSNNEEYKKIQDTIEGLTETECKKKLFEMIKEKEEKKKNKLNKKILAFEKVAEETKRNSEKINKIHNSIKGIKAKIKDKNFQIKAREDTELKDQILKQESSRKFVDYLIAGSVLWFGFTCIVLHGGPTALQEFFDDRDIEKHCGVVEGTIVSLCGIVMLGRTLLYKSLVV